MSQHSPDVLGPAAQRGRENRALTEVGCCGPPRPGVPPAAAASMPAISTNQAALKSAGNEKAAAKGPARNQDARGPSAGQVTPAAACRWAGAATCRRGGRCVDTIQQVAWHESGPRRCECINSLTGRLSLQQEGTCTGTNEAQQPDPYRRQQRSCRAMERVCRSRALSQIWLRLQCDQLVRAQRQI